MLKLAAPGKVTVAGEAIAQFPLEKLEFIVNGRVVASVTPGEDSFRINAVQEAPIETSGWIAVRALGQRGPTQQAAEAFAHTSPVYVEVAGRPQRSPDDATYFVQWIERLRTDIRGRNRIPAAEQADVEQQLAQALDFYRRLAASNPGGQ